MCVLVPVPLSGHRWAQRTDHRRWGSHRQWRKAQLATLRLIRFERGDVGAVGVDGGAESGFSVLSLEEPRGTCVGPSRMVTPLARLAGAWQALGAVLI